MKALICAASVSVALSLLPAKATEEFKNAGDFVDVYNRGGDIFILRLYIRGVGDGIVFSNAQLETRGLHPPRRTPSDAIG